MLICRRAYAHLGAPPPPPPPPRAPSRPPGKTGANRVDLGQTGHVRQAGRTARRPVGRRAGRPHPMTPGHPGNRRRTAHNASGTPSSTHRPPPIRVSSHGTAPPGRHASPGRAAPTPRHNRHAPRRARRTPGSSPDTRTASNARRRRARLPRGVVGLGMVGEWRSRHRAAQDARRAD